MSSPTRWAGVPLTDRRTERRSAAGRRGVHDCSATAARRAVSVRSVCRRMRAEHPLLLRELRRHRRTPRRGVRPRQRSNSARPSGGHDARCATTAHARPGRASRPCWASARPTPAAAGCCSPTPGPTRCSPATGRDSGSAAAPDGGRRRSATAPDAEPVAAMVGAAMYTGAMAELAQQWLAGRLGSDLDAVVDSRDGLGARPPVAPWLSARAGSSRPARRPSGATPARAGRGPCRRPRRSGLP